MNIYEFARLYGGLTEYDLSSELHSMASPQGDRNKSKAVRNNKYIQNIISIVEDTKHRYAASISSSIIKEETPLSLEERLLKNFELSPNRDVVEAARKVLNKRFGHNL